MEDLVSQVSLKGCQASLLSEWAALEVGILQLLVGELRRFLIPVGEADTEKRPADGRAVWR